MGKMKRIMGILLAFAMVLGMMPEMSLTAHAGTQVTSYDLWVGTERVDDNNKSNLADGKASFNSDTYTLTLNGANITDYHTAYYINDYPITCCIFSMLPSLTIVLKGDNNLGDIDTLPQTGILVGPYGAFFEPYSLTLEGDGTLNVVGSGDAISTVKDVTINGGNITATSTGSVGISANNDMTINGGEITANGLRGISANYDITISGGEITSTGSFDYGIYSERIILKNGIKKLEAIATKEDGGVAMYSGVSFSREGKFIIIIPENGEIGHVSDGYYTIYESGGSTIAKRAVIASIYDVTKAAATNGSFTVSSENAKIGDEITVTATPNTGYAVEKITYTDSEEHDITSAGQFTMPASDVTVTVTFKQNIQSVTLDKSEASVAVGDHAAITATVLPAEATDKTVRWSVGGTNAGSVKLYSDEACTSEVGTEATSALTVYAKGLAAGSAAVTVTSNADSSKSASMNITVNKVTPTVTAPTAKTLTYTGSAQELVNAGSATGGEMQYALGTATEATQAYSTSIPTGTDAGTYYVWYKVVGDENHKDTEVKCLPVKILTEISVAVTFKVVNGSWDDGTATDVTVTLSGPEGDTLNLTEDQIPAVGNKPAENYKAGAWDVTPSTETVITKDTTYTYSYEEEPVEQQGKVEVHDLTKLPESLTDIFSSLQDMEQTMLLKMTINGLPVTEESTRYYDMTLLVSFDGGKTWEKATAENFPESGLKVVLDYPEGTNKDNYDFAMSHVFTMTIPRLGTKAGEIETPKVTKTDKGIEVTLMGLSPVALAWTKIEETPTATPSPTPVPTQVPKTGDVTNPMLWLLLVVAGLISVLTLSAQGRRKR